jgi:type III secretion protein Q
MQVTHIAGSIPRVHPDSAAVSRVAFDARFQQWLPWVIGQPEAKVQRRMLPDESAVLEIESGEGRMHLAVDAADWPALDMALALADERQACAVASVLLAPLAQALGGAMSAARVVRRRRRVDTRRAEPGPQIVTPAGRVNLLAMSQSLRDHLQLGVTAMPADPLQVLGALKLRARLQLLHRLLPREVLAGLEPGDIVLFDPQASAAPVFKLIFGKGNTMQAQATYDQQYDQSVLSSEPTPVAEGAEMQAPADFNDLQLPVSFEVDTARISLGELSSMRPGYVIELDRPLKASVVRLVCQGQSVGHGQLVAVGEQLGIRIARIGLESGAAA